jgi:hypothetical protein
MIQALGENLPVRGTGSAQNWSMLQCLVSMPNCRIVTCGCSIFDLRKQTIQSSSNGHVHLFFCCHLFLWPHSWLNDLQVVATILTQARVFSGDISSMAWGIRNVGLHLMKMAP